MCRWTQRAARHGKFRTVVQVTSGNFLEMFDFFLFGIYARPIANAFFPSDEPYVSLMSTFLSFAAGFAMRPIGALVLGPYIDRIGRRKGLIVTLSIMACGTVLIAFVPSYATIGVLAPAAGRLGRLLQGFSAGVELGGVSVYLVEMATPGHKGFYVSWQSASQQVAIVVAALIGFAIANLMAPADVDAWGWRIPFVIGCAIVPFLYGSARSLEETAEFAARKVHPTFAQIYETLAANWAVVARRGGDGRHDDGVVLPDHRLHADVRPNGAEAERIGRAAGRPWRSPRRISSGCRFPARCPTGSAASPSWSPSPCSTLLTAYPGARLARRGAELRPDDGGRTWLSFLYAGYNGAMVVALTEIVPATVRTAGFSLAYSLATTLGGSSLAISTCLIEQTGDKASPGYWMSFAALCGLVATLYVYASKPRDAVAASPA